MNNNKFIILLQDISPIKQNRFEKYLKSPYFNSDQKLTDFYLSFRKNISLSKPMPSKVIIWKKIKGKPPLNNQKLNRYFSDLCIHLENFETIEKMKFDTLLFESTKVEVLNKPHLKKSFSSAVRTFNANICKTDSSTDKNYYLYKTQRSAHDFLYKSGGKFTNFTNLNNADFHLDKMYIIIKLQHYIEHLDYTRRYKTGPKITMSDSFIKLISQEKYQKVTTIKAFYLIQELLTNEDPGNIKFNQVYELLEDQSDKTILFEDKKNMFLALINYCIVLQINKGNEKFFILLYNIYKSALKQFIFHSNGILHFQSYKNIITVGLNVSDFKWVENFIKHYTNELQSDLRQNALNYNLAKLAYKKKEYDDVISLMNLVTYDNINYALGARMFLLRTYYETDAEIPFESLVFSFGAYIKRNKELSQNMKKQYLNFIKILKKIYYLNIFDASKITKLEAEINNTATLIHKAYLLQQWEEKIKK